MKGQIFAILFFALLFLVGVGGMLLLRAWNKSLDRFHLQERKLRDLEQSIELQHRQYAEIRQQVEQMRKFRHDLRHQNALLQSYVRTGDFAGLESFFEQQSAMRLDTSVSCCENAAVDALAQQYLGQAREKGIHVDAVLDIRDCIGISTPDLCVVLGNCLENAVEAACRVENGERFIKIRAMETAGWLSIVQENSCPPGALKETDEGYFSSKKDGRIGIGLMSVKSLAQEYDGTASYQMEDGKFRTSVILFKRNEAV